MDEIIFKKENGQCNIESFNSEIDLANLSKLNDIVFNNFTLFNSILNDNSKYKWIGKLEKKRVRVYAIETKALIKING